jgi:hypothetical protein
VAEERVQRRLAAILAADVVGYSRLIGVDEEGTLAALKARTGANSPIPRSNITTDVSSRPLGTAR